MHCTHPIHRAHRPRPAWLAALSLLVAVLHSLSVPAALRADDAVFDLDALLAPPINARTLKKSTANGIVTEEVMFHSETVAGEPIEIFGFFTYPEGGKHLPAFVWNQSGLAMANTHMITHFGSKRGYAALCFDYPVNGYRTTGPQFPINSGLATAADPRDAPIYHGAVAALRAVSFLQSRDEVDPDRIGMAGSSWGGFYTTLMVGIDPRLKVGSSFFGCGGLELGNNWWGEPGELRYPDAATVKQWVDTLDPSTRLTSVDTPMAWLTGANDQFYRMPALMKSYAAKRGEKHLTLIPNFIHGLPSAQDEQVFAYLDVHLKDATPFLDVTPLKIETSDDGAEARVTWQSSGERKFASAHLLISYSDDGQWHDRYWQTLPAATDGVGAIGSTVCSVELPKSSVPYYITGCVVDTDGYVTSTPLMHVGEARLKAINRYDAEAVPVFNGVGEWAGFEPNDVDYLRRHGFPTPAVSDDAHTGAAAATFPAGTHRMFPLLHAGGLRHRFSATMKADPPTTAALTIGDVTKTFDVTSAWTRFELEGMPAVIATLVVPEGGAVLMDDVRFEPAR